MNNPATPPADDTEQLLTSARRALGIEARAVEGLLARVDERFSAACRLCLGCKGRVVVTGMGKSGHVARKIAATLASTGTPAFFLHPAEAGHNAQLDPAQWLRRLTRLLRLLRLRQLMRPERDQSPRRR